MPSLKTNLRWPALFQWRQIFNLLTKKEKIALIIFFILFLTSSTFLGFDFYFKNTQIKPAPGGTYIEGIIGQPRFINPIYASANDVDRDLTELIFSGLMKYNQSGKVVLDLAKDYKIKEDGKVYEFFLKENILWHDGETLSADDVIFTIKTIQNPDYKSPEIANWIGVEVEKISKSAVRFKLKKTYSGFLQNLTLKIIPKHIWQNISPQNFPLTPYNLHPIGCGPFKIKNLNQNEKTGKIISLTLVKNLKYFKNPPYLSQVIFKFFDNEKELIKAATQGEINGFSFLPSKNHSSIKFPGFANYKILLPRYFSIFFNPEKSKILKNNEIRKALNYAVNKKEIIDKVLNSKAKPVHSPVLPQIYGYKPPLKIYEFNINKAKEILDEQNFKETRTGLRKKIIEKKPAFQFEKELKIGSQNKEVEELQKCLAKDSKIYPEAKITGYFGTKTKQAVIRFQEKYAEDILKPWGLTKGTGRVSKTTRTKLNEICFKSPPEILPLKFSLVVPRQSSLIEVAEILKKQLKNIGAEIEIKLAEISTIQSDFIKPRNYEALLFGEVLKNPPDPFPFWHSSQTKDPGLNLAVYKDKACDKLLEEARQTLDEQKRKEKYEEFQNLLIKKAPAIFLYSPDYDYLVSKNIKGINIKLIVDPSKRFSGIEKWYIRTHRAWK